VHVGPGRRADVDAPVLSPPVGIVAADERPQDGPVDGPGPRGGGRGDDKRAENCGEDAVANFANHEKTSRVQLASAVVKSDYSDPR
jgi:hypothetical protein